MGCVKSKEYLQQFDIEEWKKVIDILTTHRETKRYALSKSKHDIENLNELVDHFAQYDVKLSESTLFKNGKLVKAWLIYVWIAHNIEYSNQETSDNIESIFKTNKLNSEGFSSLFELLCNELNIECIQIFGFTKGFGYQIDDSFIKDNHAWNALKLDSSWYLVDLTWATGYMSHTEFIHKFNPYWFLTPAQLFIYSHYSPLYQYQNEKIGLEKFKQLPHFYLDFHLLGLKCLSHNTFKINSNSPQVFIEFSASENIILNGELYEKRNNQFVEKITNTVFIQRDSKTLNYGLIVLIPEKNKIYKLCIYAKNKTTTRSFEGVATFFVKREKDEFNETIPNYSLLFENNVKCLSHRSILINSKNETIFIEFSTPKNIFLKAVLRENLFGKKSSKIEDKIFVQRDSKTSNYGIIILIPQTDIDFRLTLSSSDSDDLFTDIGSFIIKRTNPNGLINNLPKYSLEFMYGIRCLSHFSSIINATHSPFFIEFFVPNNKNLQAKLVKFNSISNELNNNLILQKDAKTLKQGIIVLLPELNRNYKLIIFANEANMHILFEIGSFLLRAKRDKLNTKIPKYTLEYDYNLKCISHNTSLIKSKKNPVNLFFTAPLTTFLTAKLRDDKQNEIDNATLVQRTINQKNFELKVILPEKDYYYNLILYATNKNDIDSPYKQIGEFKLICSSGGFTKRFLKLYEKDLESYIFNPIEYNLKLNLVYNFKFYLKDALQVALVNQQDEMFYLKSGSNSIWSLSKSFDLVGEIKLLVKTISSGNSFEWFCSYYISKS